MDTSFYAQPNLPGWAPPPVAAPPATRPQQRAIAGPALVVGGGLLMAVGAPLPWARVVVIDIAGTHFHAGVAMLILGLAVVVAGAELLGRWFHSDSSDVALSVTGLVAAVVAALFAGHQLTTLRAIGTDWHRAVAQLPTSTPTGSGQLLGQLQQGLVGAFSVGPASGIYVALAGTVIAAAGAIWVAVRQA